MSFISQQRDRRVYSDGSVYTVYTFNDDSFPLGVRVILHVVFILRSVWDKNIQPSVTV